MIDKQKLNHLAKIIVNYSIKVKPEEKILLRGYGFDSYPLIKKLYRECVKAGAMQVDIRFSHTEMSRVFFENANQKQLEYRSRIDEDLAKTFDAMVQVVAEENPYEMEGVDIKKVNLHQKALKPLSDILHHKRWCLLYYPNLSSAQTAKKSLEQWEDFVLDSCIKDWPIEEKNQRKLIKVLEKVDQIRVTGEDTDLKMSVKNQKWRTCCGKFNLPDGEVFSSPIKNSVEGSIKFNVPTHYLSKDFDWIKLVFKQGKIVKEEANQNTKALSAILNTDPGARFVGEIAFGLNRTINEGTRLIIFDEKMNKSLHMAMGKCYEDCPNGNDSQIHWDMIFNFLWAKATIYFDGKKVFADGKWIDARLKFLN
jgi:aminopeptidase